MLRDALAAFQPQEIGFIADPYPAYGELRRAGRIQYDERTDHWLITRHADVDALLRDRRLGRSYLHRATHDAFETILRRMPRLELLREPEWKPTYIIRGLKSLPVRA